MKRFLFLLTFVIGCRASAAPFFDKVVSEQYSPRADILVQHYFERQTDRGSTDQIWLVSAANPAQRHLLFTHWRHAEVVFSDDEKWLVINDQYASNASRLLLYRQKSPLRYEQVTDLTAKAWEFFSQQNGRTRPTSFDHSYVEALRWADDEPPTLLLCLSGHVDSQNHTSEWYCFYNVQSQTFDTDFGVHNKKMTTLAPE